MLLTTPKMQEEKYIISSLRKEDFTEICRCCLSESPTYKIFELDFEGIPFFQILQSLFNTEFKKDDELPKHICTSCMTHVVAYLKFKRSFDVAQVILLSIIKEFVEQISIKTESECDENVTEIKTEEDREDLIEQQHGVAPSSHNKELNLVTTQESSPKTTISNSNAASDIVCSCLETFATKSEYLSHKRRQTDKKKHVRLYRCQVCSKYFKRQRFLIHQRSHTNERPYKCKSCPQSFKSDSNLMRHSRTHSGEKRYVCDICGKAFSHITGLTPHKMSHTHEKPHLCNICGKQFKCKTSLNTHAVSHGVGSLKKHLCSHCGKKFKGPSGLKMHLYTHTGERPFVCTICGKRFTQKSVLKDHSYVHTGLKPFPCEFCERRFVRSHQWRRHLRVHI